MKTHHSRVNQHRCGKNPVLSLFGVVSPQLLENKHHDELTGQGAQHQRGTHQGSQQGPA